MMIGDLEAEEFVNRLQRLRIDCVDLYLATGRDFFKLIRNLRSFLFHYRYAGWHLVMDERWSREVAFREHRSDICLRCERIA